MKYFFTVLFISISAIASATNYYVSPSGRNTNPGTLSSPFKTISFAESKLADGVGGNTIYVRGGTYNEGVMFHLSSGIAGNPNVLIAYQNEKVIIDGTGISIGAGSALVFTWSDYINIIGLEIRNCNMTGVYAGGSGIWFAGTGCVASNCIVHDAWAGGIRSTGNYATIENNLVYNAAMSNTDGFQSPGETWSCGINVRECSYNIVRHNIVHDVWGEGVSSTRCSHSTIEDNIYL